MDVVIVRLKVECCLKADDAKRGSLVVAIVIQNNLLGRKVRLTSTQQCDSLSLTRDVKWSSIRDCEL